VLFCRGQRNFSSFTPGTGASDSISYDFRPTSRFPIMPTPNADEFSLDFTPSAVHNTPIFGTTPSVTGIEIPQTLAFSLSVSQPFPMSNSKLTSIDQLESGLLNITEQLYETRVRPEEERFHSIFCESILGASDAGLRSGRSFSSNAIQANVARDFSKVTHYKFRFISNMIFSPLLKRQYCRY